MLLALHITVALTSVAYASYLLLSPIGERFKYAYMLIISTLISGTVLVIAAHSNILRACTTGIAYLVIVSACMAAASYRLSVAKQRIDDNN